MSKFLSQTVDKSYSKVLEQLATNQIVLLHPHSNYRSIILANLLKEDQYSTFYYAIQADDRSLKAFLENFIRKLSSQQETFGRHLNILLPEILDDLEANLQTVVSAFVRELRELSDQDFILILDEFDRSDTVDGIQSFIEAVVNQLPVKCHLVLNARTSPRLPWLALLAENKASIVLDDQVIQEDFYGIRNKDAETRLEIFAFGQGYINFGGRKISDWEGHLPRLLMFFSMDKPAVTRSEICRAFWPNLGLDQAVNVFHVTKRRLHKAIDVDILYHDDNYYTTSRNLYIEYDVLRFVELLVAGRASVPVGGIAKKFGESPPFYLMYLLVCRYSCVAFPKCPLVLIFEFTLVATYLAQIVLDRS
jgi:hypothetical protein